MVEVPVTLHNLCRPVDRVAAEEEVVLRGDSEGVAHEDGRVADEGCGHTTGDTMG